MSASIERRVTYDELPDDGRRWELLDGVPRVTPSPVRRHQTILWRLGRAFEEALGEGDEFYLAPMDVVLAPETAFQPDLVVVLGGNRGVLREVIRGVPDLVVEVASPSTAAFDRGAKKRAYARHGVPELWLVDPEAETVEVHRLAPGAHLYRRASLSRRGERAASPALPNLVLDLDALFAK